MTNLKIFLLLISECMYISYGSLCRVPGSDVQYKLGESWTISDCGSYCVCQRGGHIACVGCGVSGPSGCREPHTGTYHDVGATWQSSECGASCTCEAADSIVCAECPESVPSGCLDPDTGIVHAVGERWSTSDCGSNCFCEGPGRMGCVGCPLVRREEWDSGSDADSSGRVCRNLRTGQVFEAGDTWTISDCGAYCRCMGRGELACVGCDISVRPSVRKANLD